MRAIDAGAMGFIPKTSSNQLLLNALRLVLAGGTLAMLKRWGVADMTAVNAAMKGLTPKQMAEDIGVPLHPGAKKYFKEIGAL